MNFLPFPQASWSKSALIIIAGILTFSFFNHAVWNKKVIAEDIIEYYGYLPAAFIYDDVGMSFTGGNYYYGDKFWGLPGDSLFRYQKFTMGLAFAYAPFFLIAHAYCHFTGIPATGFTPPYPLLLLVSTLVFGFMGLIYFRKLLLRFFGEWASAFTLIAIFLGTNLFSYITHLAPLSHAYLFCLVAAFLHYTFRFFEKPGPLTASLAGLSCGWLVLIRPADAPVAMLPLLLFFSRPGTPREKFAFMKKQFPAILLFSTSVLIVFLPQFIYWKHTSGSWLVYGYGDEGFHFSNPHIVEGLFSFRNGWLIYTPMMFPALAGLPFLFHRHRELTIPFLLILLACSTIILSWWCWWYGGSFGNRAFVDLYPILGLGFAALFHGLQKSGLAKQIPVIILVSFFIFLNQFQAMQYRRNVLTQDSMTAKSYAAIFLKGEKPENLSQLIELPDYEAAKKRRAENN